MEQDLKPEDPSSQAAADNSNQAVDSSPQETTEATEKKEESPNSPTDGVKENGDSGIAPVEMNFLSVEKDDQNSTNNDSLSIPRVEMMSTAKEVKDSTMN